MIKELIVEDNTSVENNSVIIDLYSFCIVVNGKKLSAAKKIIQMAHYLLSNRRRPVTRQELLSRIWGDDIIVGPRTIDVHVRKLRMLIGDKYITTVKDVGYQWKQ